MRKLVKQLRKKAISRGGYCVIYGNQWDNEIFKAKGKKVSFIVGRAHTQKSNLPVALIQIKGIEVVGHQQDLAVSTGAVYDATYPVCGDWRGSIPAAS